MKPTSDMTIGYLLRSYPRLSQTFILNEILALERLGLRLQIFAGTNPREVVAQQEVADVRAPVDYLDESLSRGRATLLADHLRVLAAAPRRYLGALRYLLRARSIDQAYTSQSRFTCWHQAVHLAARLRRGTLRLRHMHAHFAHDPTLIAYLVWRLTGLPYSFTAHARDLYQIPQDALIDRVAAATAVITCCSANAEYLQAVLPESEQSKLQVIHHGVDLQGFVPAEPRVDGAEPPLILSVGRLVEKKGFPDLLLACSKLVKSGQQFRCVIFGDGPQRNQLEEQIRHLGVEDAVLLADPIPQRDLALVFQRADLFVLAPFVTDDGDRDGIPNVLVEAMACGVPTVSTRVAGIPELVQHGRNGLLAAPRNVDELATHIHSLLSDGARRRQLGTAGRQTVVENFDLSRAAQRLVGLFNGRELVEAAES